MTKHSGNTHARPASALTFLAAFGVADCLNLAQSAKCASSMNCAGEGGNVNCYCSAN